ncbi:MAG: cytochrome c3 family protein [Candidatus Limnocylindrales bacterium]
MSRLARLLRRIDRYLIAIVALSAAIGLMVGVAVIGIAIPELQRAGIIEVAARSEPAPSATPLLGDGSEMAMGAALVPANAQCAGCHATGSGTIGALSIPAMGHPLEGWSQCTACHAPGKLVETAPGHAGIDVSQCTICHKPGDLPAPLSRPHRANQNVACLSCHGSTAPLPADMTHRKETACWLCHRLPTVEPPVPAHATSPGEADCRTCHTAGGKAGALPSDHLDRASSVCLSCHEVTLGTSPQSTPLITSWPAPPATATPATTPLVPITP